MRRALVLVTILAALSAVHADEGMWQPAELPSLSATLERMGLEIDPAKLQDLTTHPMNAVISLGYCTASFVSPEGLVITNHHCAERSIQHNSTPEWNLLEEGFLAKSRADELPAAPGTRVWVTESVRDVTAQVLDGLDAKLGGRERYRRIEERVKALVAECERAEGRRCDVYPFHGGLYYRLIRKLEIRDVRLVYAPSRSIGVYGGDIDNWMWPRHTGDFAFYRTYVGPDGNPADPSDENIPFHPPHYLRISTEGVDEGDFVMIAGYPGSTSRHRLASEVADRFEWYYPTRRKLLTQWLEIIARETEGRAEAALKYASLVSRLNNSVKNYEGMIAGFEKSDILERKKRLEEDLERWIGSDPDHGARFHSALADLRALVDRARARRERDMLYGYLIGRGELLRAARTLYRLSRERQKPDKDREPDYQERNWDRIHDRMARIDRTFDPIVDRAAWRQFILDYAAIPPDQHVAAFDEWFGIRGGSVDEAALDRRLEEMYSGTRLHLGEARREWLEASPSRFEKSEDPFVRLAVALYDSDIQAEEEEKELDGLFDAARPRYMQALMARLAEKGRPVYADANGTLRVSYGRVSGHSPKDGMEFTPFTTLRGIAEKDTGAAPFDAPPSELEAVSQEKWGRFGDANLGSVPVNYLTTVDLTGGNSGSPTLNSKAELVGLAFDSNWESIIADWDFIPSLTRGIHVDIRYVLWVMEELDGANHLLREMGIPAGGRIAARIPAGS